MFHRDVHSGFQGLAIPLQQLHITVPLSAAREDRGTGLRSLSACDSEAAGKTKHAASMLNPLSLLRTTSSSQSLLSTAGIETFLFSIPQDSYTDHGRHGSVPGKASAQSICHAHLDLLQEAWFNCHKIISGY